MESNVLNFPNAMRLAELVLGFFSLDEIKTLPRDVLILDFIEKISTQEMSEIVKMFINPNAKLEDSDALGQVMKSLTSVDFSTLVTTYTKAGFANDA